MKCKRSSDGRSLDHHTLQQMRMQAVKAVREGAAVPEVARAYGMNPRTIYRWLADFVDGGQQALLAKEIPGRPSKLSADELRWIPEFDTSAEDSHWQPRSHGRLRRILTKGA